MRSRLLTFALGAVVFVFGAVAGGLAMRAVDLRIAGEWMRQPPVERREVLLERILVRRLDLDDAQAARLRSQLRAQRPAVEAIHAASAAERSRLRHELLEATADVLQEEQREELEWLLEAADRREGR